MNPGKSHEIAPNESVREASESAQISAVDPERWVEEHGDILFGFAAARVRNHAIAQDLVQETFLAAIKARSGFARRATERSWLFGILRHKLADYYRLQNREVAIADLESPLPEEEGAFGASGVRKDGWLNTHAPQAWRTPDQDLVTKEFQEVFRSCLSRLPGKVAHVFQLREIDGVSSEQICKDLDVSANNVWVMLHRARMALRRCLEVHWFGRKGTTDI